MFEDQNKKNISDKWITEVIYPALDKLNNSFFLIQNGCRDVYEYAETSNRSIEEIKYANIGIFLSSVKFILINGKALFQKQVHNSILEKISFLYKIYREELLIIEYNELTKSNQYHLLEGTYQIIIREIEKIQLELIDELESILFIGGNIRYK